MKKLIEELEKLTGKKISLQEATGVSDKDWDRMLTLTLSGKDGAGIAQTITDKNKAIARFVAGTKLEGNTPQLSGEGRYAYYYGSFGDFGTRALQLGATPEEIQTIFDQTSIPDKYVQKLQTLGAKDKKMGSGAVGAISKLIIDSGKDIKYLPTNGNAITHEGKEAMSRNGRKWTMGFRAEVNLGDRVVKFVFDAITDEGDGPTYYVVSHESEMLKNVRGVVGLREFLAAIKREISTPVPVVSEAKEQTNITNLSSLKEGDKFKILEDGALQIRAFMYKLPYELNKDLVFIVQKATPHTVFAIGAGNEKYQDEKGRVPFKITNTGHWRSEGKDIKVKKLS